MNSPTEPTAPGPGAAPFRLGRWLAWLALCLPLCVVIAAASVEVRRRGFTPLVIASCTFGLLLGVALVAMLRAVGMGHRRSALLAAAALGLLTAAAQHPLAYARYRAAYRQARQSSPLLVLAQNQGGDFGPVDFARFMQVQAQGARIGHWALDAALICLTTTLCVAVALRQPLCPACGSWYRCRERGPLRQPQAGSLAAWAGVDVPDSVAHFQYRLLACRRACGPIGLELSWWRGHRREWSRPTWIDARRRGELTERLDRGRFLAG